MLLEYEELLLQVGMLRRSREESERSTERTGLVQLPEWSGWIVALPL